MATYTTAVTVAMTSHSDITDDDIVTFMIDEFYEHSDNKLQVFYGGLMLDFRDHAARVQEFQGSSFHMSANPPAGIPHHPGHPTTRDSNFLVEFLTCRRIHEV